MATWESILMAIVSTILTALASVFVGWLTGLINTKIKDNKLKRYLNSALSVTTMVVKQTYQTYVEALKSGGVFEADKQKEALTQAVATVNGLINNEVKEAITENFGDFDSWLIAQIESAIYDLKNKNSVKEDLNEDN